MGYIIYVDVYFFMNFLMNSLLLLLLRKVDGKGEAPIQKKEVLRIMAGALIGGILSCLFVLVFWEISFFLEVSLINGLLAYLMVWIAFGYKSVKQRLQAVVKLCLLEIMLGGILNMLINEAEFLPSLISGSENSERNSLFLIVGISTAATFLIKRIWLYYKKENYIHSHLYEVELVHNGKSSKGVGLLDTGNHLKEPISGKAVVIGTWGAVEGIVGTEKAIRWIPYHSLGKKNGLMPGVIVDEMIIYKEGMRKVSKKVLIGIVKEELSSEGKYQFILHEEYMEMAG